MRRNSSFAVVCQRLIFALVLVSSQHTGTKDLRDQTRHMVRLYRGVEGGKKIFFVLRRGEANTTFYANYLRDERFVL